MASSRFPVAPRHLALIALLVIASGAAGWWFGTSRASLGEKARVEAIVRDYVLEHPEILPQAMERLQARETGKRLAAATGIETPYPGAVLGNPKGSVTLVEFSDFACGYCRASVPEIDALIARNPQLKVVLRELPILSPGSELAARWGLAAAEQGKYAAFHKAMFAAGRPDAGTVAAAARSAGLDIARAEKTIDQPAVTRELERNVGMARQLGLEGTPAFVIKGELYPGAVGRDVLQRAIDGKGPPPPVAG